MYPTRWTLCALQLGKLGSLALQVMSLTAIAWTAGESTKDHATGLPLSPPGDLGIEGRVHIRNPEYGVLFREDMHSGEIGMSSSTESGGEQSRGGCEHAGPYT